MTYKTLGFFVATGLFISLVSFATADTQRQKIEGHSHDLAVAVAALKERRVQPTVAALPEVAGDSIILPEKHLSSAAPILAKELPKPLPAKVVTSIPVVPLKPLPAVQPVSTTIYRVIDDAGPASTRQSEGGEDRREDHPEEEDD